MPPMQKRKAAKASREVQEPESVDAAFPVLKKPAAAADPILKQPAGAMVEDNPSTLKRPAAAMVEDSSEDPSILKRPAAASVLKRPASAEAEAAGDEGEEGEEEPMKAAKDGKAEAKDARSAARQVASKKGQIKRLERVQDAMAEKMKANKKLLNVAFKELEDLQAEARKKGSKANRIKAARLEEKLTAQAEKLAERRSRAGGSLKVARKRALKASEKAKVAKAKAEDVQSNVTRARRGYEETVRRCNELEQKGEHVPKTVDDAQDFSNPHAWKPPGVTAAKERQRAKEVLKTAEDAFNKVASVTSLVEQRAKAVRERLSSVKQKVRGTAEENALLAKITKGKRKARGSSKAMKAMKAKAVKKTMKAMKGRM